MIMKYSVCSGPSEIKTKLIDLHVVVLMGELATNDVYQRLWNSYSLLY